MINCLIRINAIAVFVAIVVSGQQDDNLLLVVSFDAFRPEYFNRDVTPFMNDLRKKGSYTEYLRNVFPTKTFTNHHTISTGMFPEEHGVLGNTLYDAKLKKELKYGYELFHYKEDIMPIWALNQRYGRHSGCMMWPGTDFPYGGQTCDFTIKFNMSAPWTERVDKGISWFKDPDTPANFVMMYFEEPDYFGHAFSPESQVITDMVQKMDELTEYIEEKLISENLRSRMNVIYLSDHGMESVSSPNFINFTSYLERGTYQFYGSSPVVQIIPQDGKYNITLDRLKKAAAKNGHFNAYSNEELPKRWHVQNTDRMGPITVVADEKYAFQDMYDNAIYYEKAFNISISPTQKYGIHGYDNEYPSMRAIFFANGPKFRKQYLHPPFDNLDLFNLICLILDMKPTRNNGTVENVRDLLVDSVPESSGHNMVLGISLAALSLVLLVALFISYRMYRKRHTIKHYTLDNETGDAPEDLYFVL
ncbi:ectonucleotide pyrophosphatase/phosphodiesterase family member 5-like isoform X2 [Bradysia coprophila]|uniref:ectonucleotide pyrophosphatase/phosphodiesterase family member 5-like isoform X2 n=1 Tax=Bradysia coprophila TaxID=38358 RepID=UPI00187D966D|nr:ectonucleotide pyrophosphatase/phosphodiesterase family member 5-like isoform X2 [Bradysia coprophila]